MLNVLATKICFNRSLSLMNVFLTNDSK